LRQMTHKQKSTIPERTENPLLPFRKLIHAGQIKNTRAKKLSTAGGFPGSSAFPGNQMTLTMIGTPHQRSAFHIIKAHFITFFPVKGKFIGMYKTKYREMAGGGLQVLTKGKHVQSIGHKVFHGGQHFVTGFPK